MGMTDVAVKYCNSVAEAPQYKEPEFKAVTLDEIVIVKEGTVEGNPTVDLIFTDHQGQKYVALITARLLSTALGVLV